MQNEQRAAHGAVRVSALARGLTVLDAVAEQASMRGVSLTELSQAVGLDKATTYRLLVTLEADSYVERDPDSERYRLGVKILRLSSVLLQNLDLRIQAAPFLSDLMVRTNETVHLGVLDQASVVYIDKVDCTSPIRMHSRVGMHMPAHSTALGKAILAFSPDELVETVIAQGLFARTPHTITEPRGFRAQLQKIRGRGYSIDNCENEEDIRCVGAPVFDHGNRVIGAVSISGPATRFTLERTAEIGPIVRDFGLQISRRMGCSL